MTVLSNDLSLFYIFIVHFTMTNNFQIWVNITWLSTCYLEIWLFSWQNRVSYVHKNFIELTNLIMEPDSAHDTGMYRGSLTIKARICVHYRVIHHISHISGNEVWKVWQHLKKFKWLHCATCPTFHRRLPESMYSKCMLLKYIVISSYYLLFVFIPRTKELGVRYCCCHVCLYVCKQFV